MSKYKKCKLLNKIIIAKPGERLRCYGHDWVVQPNGDAIADIHVDFHKVEVASGRYIVLEDKPEPQTFTHDEVPDFTMDIETYFGCGDIDNLRKKIGYQRKDTIILFARSRLNITLPESMSKADMITEIIDLVKYKDENEDTNREDAAIENEIFLGAAN